MEESAVIPRVDIAGLGKYCRGRYGRIGVHRVKGNQHKKNMAILQ